LHQKRRFSCSVVVEVLKEALSQQKEEYLRVILKMTTKKMTTLVKQVIIFYEPSATLFEELCNLAKP